MQTNLTTCKIHHNMMAYFCPLFQRIGAGRRGACSNHYHFARVSV